MNIVREQRGENNSLIRVTVGEADYGQEVEKSLREYKRKANIPGFRPGMVPMGIVKKMYGKGVLAEQSYRQASNAVFEYRLRFRQRHRVRIRVRDRRGSRDQAGAFRQG